MCSKYSYWFSYDNLDLWPHSSSQPVRARQNTSGHFLEATKGIEHWAIPWVVLSSLWPISTSGSRFQKLCSQVWLLRLVYGALTMLRGRNLVPTRQVKQKHKTNAGTPSILSWSSPNKAFYCICISDLSSPWEARRFSEQTWSPRGLVSYETAESTLCPKYFSMKLSSVIVDLCLDVHGDEGHTQ